MATPFTRILSRFFSTKDGLSHEERLVRQKFDYYLRGNFKNLRALYRRRFQNVLNTDQAKELCDEYAANEAEKIRFSRCVYEPAKAFIKKMFEIEVVEKSVSTVIFLAGGAGSGKSTAVESWKAAGKFPPNLLVVDGTLSDQEEARHQVNLALEHEKQVLIIYVFCPIAKAVQLALDRAIQRGRGLPIGRLAQTHYDSQKTVLALHRDLSSHPLVDVKVFDNSLSRPTASDMLSVERDEYQSLDTLKIAAHSALLYEQHTRKESGKPLPAEIAELFNKNG